MTDEIKKEYIFTWRIENYNTLSHKTGYYLASPLFAIKFLSRTKFYLSIYPGGNNEEVKDTISLYLVKCSDCESEEKNVFDFEIRLLNVDGKIIGNSTYTNATLDKRSSTWGWNNFIHNSKVKASVKKCSKDVLVVHCLVTIKEGEGQQIEKAEARTRNITEKYSFEWMVNFLEHIGFPDEKFFFCLETILYEINFCVSDDFAVINIHKRSNSSTPRLVKAKITLHDAYGIDVISKTETYTFDSENDKGTWEFPSFITKKLLQDSRDKNAKDGTVCLLCEFSVLKDTAAAPRSTNKVDVSDIDNLLTLREDFRNLLASKHLSDIELRADSEVWRAHKCILAARSPVYTAMFDQEMLENRTGIVDIVDVDSNSLQSFLKFLYTGEIYDLTCEKAMKLLLVADKYQVPSLKKKCCTILMASLSKENVCEILVLADMVQHECLKKMCENFVAQHAGEIFSSTDWLLLVKENPRLSSEVIVYVGQNCVIVPKSSTNK